MTPHEFTTDATAERLILRSRFVGCAVRLEEPAVEEALDRIRQQFPGASHYCSAYRWAPGHERADDHGEPRGTAGLPLLATLQRANLVHALVVVVRYFGGVKLGRPGLYRAYQEVAQLAVAAARPAPLQELQRVRLTCSYAAFDAVRRWVAAVYANTPLDVPPFQFDAEVHWRGVVPRTAESDAETLRERWHGEVDWMVEATTLGVWPDRADDDSADR
ncbi:MAG: YigZ family protein [Thermaerobacter sp.]|nr:YigZ family protein [Thermaerobacter sp.]